MLQLLPLFLSHLTASAYWLILFFLIRQMFIALTVRGVFRNKASFPASDSRIQHRPSSDSTSWPPGLSWKIRVAVSVISRITDSVCRTDGTVNRRALRFFDPEFPPCSIPILGVSTSDISVHPARNLWFRIFTPSICDAASGSLPVVFFFHGGGFTFHSPASLVFEAVCRRLAKELQAVIVSSNYRLCPEHRFPSQYDDCWDVLKYVDEHSHELPNAADITRSFFAGDSAGGNIAHHLAVRACTSRLEAVNIRGLILIQPFFGGEERTEAEIRLPNAPIASLDRADWCWRAFLPEGEDRDHWAVNVTGPNAVDIAALDGFPATLLFAAGFDSLRDWQKRYYEWLKRSGKKVELVEYPKMCHSFYVVPNLPESGQLINEVKRFIGRNGPRNLGSTN